MKSLPALLVVVVLLACTAYVNAAPAPFTGFTPSGYEWWSQLGHPALYVLLPVDARVGTQTAFFYVELGDTANATVAAWIGNGEKVLRQDEFEAQGKKWQARWVSGSGRRGLIGTSADKQWTFVAIAPEGEWDQFAATYSDILNGGRK